MSGDRDQCPTAPPNCSPMDWSLFSCQLRAMSGAQFTEISMTRLQFVRSQDWLLGPGHNSLINTCLDLINSWISEPVFAIPEPWCETITHEAPIVSMGAGSGGNLGETLLFFWSNERLAHFNDRIKRKFESRYTFQSWFNRERRYTKPSSYWILTEHLYQSCPAAHLSNDRDSRHTLQPLLMWNFKGVPRCLFPVEMGSIFLGDKTRQGGINLEFVFEFREPH